MRMTPAYRSVASFSHIAKLRVSLWWHTAASGVELDGALRSAGRLSRYLGKAVGDLFACASLGTAATEAHAEVT